MLCGAFCLLATFLPLLYRLSDSLVTVPLLDQKMLIIHENQLFQQ